MTDTRDWADDAAREICDSIPFITWGSANDAQARIATALRAARRVPDGHIREGDVLRCSVDISVKQAASFAGGIDEFVRLSMEQAGSSMADRIRAAAEAARGRE